ncbi:hypothetical protein [Streptomyces sp. NPDC050388]|uniref:hypothetical protein n=1 Tax=Streptomyces sp. NPDC050388 TaxID=3155781 RepID=UPI003414E3CB
MVRMRHPNLEQEIEVAEISVVQYERSGWQVVDDNGRTAKGTAKRRQSEGNES